MLSHRVLHTPLAVEASQGQKTVLVTGGSGFLAGWCVIQLLRQGHRVRTTVRDLAREAEVREGVAAEVEAGDRLSVLAADLLGDDGWAEAVEGCDYVLHVASPFPPAQPKDPDELIVPARDGTLRVLRAGLDAGVERIVVTSSVAAISGGRERSAGPLTEENWSDPDNPKLTPYARSKTIAERAAWDFVAKEGGPELAVVNPVAVLGPVLGPDYSPSIMIVQRMMDGAIPGCPQRWFGVVDVRDVADLHLRAMTHAAARGERFLCTGGDFMSMLEIAKVLKARMGAAAAKVPARQLPNWLVRLAALRDPALKQLIPELGKQKNGTNAKARGLLGWKPRSSEDAIVASAESLIRLGLLKSTSQQAA
jgi:nucleoside-diphosphate-sugar epimerase